MNFVDSLDGMVRTGGLLAVICIVLYVLIGRIWFGKRRRAHGTASSLGNALQQLQAIAQPSIQHAIEEKLKEKKDEDDQGGPDDPGTYYRRLRERIDQQTRTGVGEPDDEAESKST